MTAPEVRRLLVVLAVPEQQRGFLCTGRGGGANAKRRPAVPTTAVAHAMP